MVPEPKDPASEGPEDEEEPEEEEPGEPASEGSGEAEAPPEEEEEEVPEFADLPVPSLDELRAALDWAFEGDELPDGYLDRCAEHAVLVQTANRVMNLTKVVDPKEIAAKHYLDSWRAGTFLPLMGRSLLDLGSGGGYPGVPIALAEPNTKVVLCDSIQKKADFLAESVAKMGLTNVSAIGDRAEEHLLRNQYDVVIVRAVSSVRENVRTLRKVRHSLRDLVMLKGPSWSREVRAGEREAERLGFKLETVWEHELPEGMGKRAILIYRAPGAQGA